MVMIQLGYRIPSILRTSPRYSYLRFIIKLIPFAFCQIFFVINHALQPYIIVYSHWQIQLYSDVFCILWNVPMIYRTYVLLSLLGYHHLQVLLHGRQRINNLFQLLVMFSILPRHDHFISHSASSDWFLQCLLFLAPSNFIDFNEDDKVQQYTRDLFSERPMWTLSAIKQVNSYQIIFSLLFFLPDLHAMASLLVVSILMTSIISIIIMMYVVYLVFFSTSFIPKCVNLIIISNLKHIVVIYMWCLCILNKMYVLS